MGLASVRLRDVVRDVTVIRKSASPTSSLPAGARVRCDECSETHYVIPCTSPNFPELRFVYCGEAVKLASIGEHTFFKIDP